MTRVDRASIMIEAAPTQVYRALVDPEILVLWLPPEGVRADIDLFEARVGGRISITLTFAAGTDATGKTTVDTDVLKGWFVELTPDVRVVQRYKFMSADPAFAGDMLMTWTLQRNDQGTLLALAAEDVPIGIDPEVHERAMASSLAKLAALAVDLR